METIVLVQKDYKKNFFAFVWHATLLAFAKSFIDTDTILPALILKAGGNEFLIGLMTAIMLGGAKFFQLFFAPFIASRRNKKFHLLVAIYIRVLAILSLAVIIYFFESFSPFAFFIVLFGLILIFTSSGSYGGVAYTDILGKSVLVEKRKVLFSLKQMFQAIGFVASAFLVKIILKKIPYPENYAFSFFIAGLILIIASIGFLLLREKTIIPSHKKTVWQFIKKIPGEFRKNPNLKFFLLTINTLGVTFSFIPFMVSFLKNNNAFSAEIIGNILIIKMSGVVFGSLAVYFFRDKIKYKILLAVSSVLGFLLPLASLFIVKNLLLFEILFFVAGMIFSFIRIAAEGIIIEISNETNRSEYAGIVGAGNLSGIIFPFLVGGLLSIWGYYIVFPLVSIVALVSLFFIIKLDC